MKNIVKVIYVILSALFLIYLLPKSPEFPNFPENVLISDEPGDTKDPNIRAFFTDLDRNEVMNYYTQEFKNEGIFGVTYLTYRLNYPPENAQIIIQDQLRSSFLEEVIHPFRESIFINGFKPKTEKDEIFIKGRHFNQKITLRYVPSPMYSRLFIGLITIVLPHLIYVPWRNELLKFVNTKTKILKRR